MSPELSRRVAAAFQVGEPSREERDLLIREVSRRDVRSARDMSPTAQTLLARLEQRD